MRAGELLGGRFELLQRIGSGGMGEVFRAADRASKREVAVKVMLDTGIERAARFAREARVLEDLSHPGIVRYVAHGVTAEGEPYLAMEWLEGEDLKARLERAPLSLGETFSVVSQAAAALGAAHARAIVHRDVKPANLFLVGSSVERVVVLDFGIARVARATALTRTGMLIGTPGYMAPEQAANDPGIDARADVFALGAVLFRCLTNRPAFTGEHVAAVLASILFEEAPRVRDVRPDLPEALDALVTRMLARDPRQRPRDGAEVRAALAAIEAASAGPTLDSVVRSTPALMGGERPIVSMVLMGSTHAPDGAAPAEDDAELSRAAEPYGGRVTTLADGSLLVTIAAENGAATDYAARSARCALALRARSPKRPTALVMGRSEVTGQRLTGAVVDQAMGLLLRVDEARREASPMPIVLNDVICALLDGRFEVAESEFGHLLLGEHELSQGARRLLGKPTACVGRETELTTLLSAWSACVDESAPQAVVVTGPPGVGKSRLGAEVLSRLRRRGEPFFVWQARGDPMRAGSPLGLLGQALRGALGVREGEPLRARQDRILARVVERVPRSTMGQSPAERRRVAEFLGELCGAPFSDEDSPALRAARQDAQLMIEQLRRSFLDFVGAEARAFPVLLVLEDLHWGDAATVRFVDAALRELVDCPLMVLALARPDPLELLPKRWAEIRLGGLSRKASERLVRQVLGESVGPETVEKLARLAGGNAFYLEELIRAAAEGKSELPETVLAMVEAHLARLGGEERRVLRAASVFGEVCWESGVGSLLGGTMQASEASSVLDALVAGELLQRRPESRFPGERELAFRHALLRDGAYAMLTKEDAQRGHKLAGAWLDAHGEADPAVLAGHFERGGELARAAPLYARATHEAIFGSDPEATVAHAERGLACGAEGPTRGILLLGQTVASFRRADFAAMARSGTEALALLSPGSRPWCRCMFQLLSAAGFAGQKRWFDALLSTFLSAEPAEDAAAAYQEAGSTAVSAASVTGSRDHVRALLSRMLEVDARASLLNEIARGRLKYGLSAYALILEPDPWGGWLAIREARQCFEAHGDRRMIATVLASGGDVEASLFGIERGITSMRAGLAAAKRTGEAFTIALCSSFFSHLLGQQGPPESLAEARGLAEAVVAAVDPRVFHVGCAWTALSHVARRRGDAATAIEHAEHARKVFFTSRALWPLGLTAHVEALLAAGKSAEACAVGDEGLAHVEALGGAGIHEIPLRLAAAEARLAAGDRELARSAIDDALAALAARAGTIPDEAARAHYLERVPAHARVAELAQRLGVGAG